MTTVEHAPARRGPLAWDQLRTRLDDNAAFNTMRGTPYYADAVYAQFSPHEMARRYAALRDKMRALGPDCAIVPGGPSHWSFGGGMLWLSGHWEWHGVAAYVVVPLEGEPTLVYGMGGTHIEAVRREVAGAIADVRQSRNGRFGEVIGERIRELGLDRGRIGLLEVDPRWGDHLPINQYDMLRAALPDAELVLTHGIMHELLCIHSAEEIDCIRTAARLCDRAMEALVDRARPGTKEYQLRAAATHAILDGGGDVDFMIIGSTPMADPMMVFGNPRPSSRELQAGDLVMMELAAGYRGYTAQIGSPVCIGEPTREVRRFFDDIVLPGFERMVDSIGPDRSLEEARSAGRFFREHGAQSRPIHVHGIDLVSSSPHVFTDHVDSEAGDDILQPGMVLVVEPTPITADGSLGMFFGHTFAITSDGRECLDQFPWRLTVVPV